MATDTPFALHPLRLRPISDSLLSWFPSSCRYSIRSGVRPGHEGEKVRIGHAAARLIREGETIMLEAQLNGLMIRVAREVTAVADSSKFHRRSLSVICDVSDVHRIVTDDGADPKLVAALRARNLAVMVV